MNIWNFRSHKQHLIASLLVLCQTCFSFMCWPFQELLAFRWWCAKEKINMMSKWLKKNFESSCGLNLLGQFSTRPPLLQYGCEHLQTLLQKEGSTLTFISLYVVWFSATDHSERTKPDHLHPRYVSFPSFISCGCFAKLYLLLGTGQCPFKSQICWWWGCKWIRQCTDPLSPTDNTGKKMSRCMLFVIFCHCCCCCLQILSIVNPLHWHL